MPTKPRILRQDARWPRAHERLRELFQERIPDGMTQEEFGERYGIGSQGMVWQYLNGWTPLNIEAAEKFAAGLNCTIADISQEMASYIKERIVVRLGKISRRVAMLAGAGLYLWALSHDAQSVLHNHFSYLASLQLVDLSGLIHIALLTTLAAVLLYGVSHKGKPVRIFRADG